jgi:hypothetical protein
MHAEQLLLGSSIKRKRLLARLKLETKRRGKPRDKLIRTRMEMVGLRSVVRLVMARRRRRRRR